MQSYSEQVCICIIENRGELREIQECSHFHWLRVDTHFAHSFRDSGQTSISDTSELQRSLFSYRNMPQQQSFQVVNQSCASSCDPRSWRGASGHRCPPSFLDERS